MNEQRFGKEIKGFLNQGLDLPEAQLDRLRVARQNALARQRVAPAWLVALVPAAVANGSMLRAGNPQSMLLRWGLPLVIATAMLVGLQQWQHTEEPDPTAETMADIDSELLKGDLPIKAYLDNGFREWLRGDE